MTRIGAAIDRRLAPRIFDLMVLIPVRAGSRQDALQPGRDLDAVRGFMSGLGPTTFFDLPWVPIFLGLCFLLHVWIGLTALVACVVLLAVTLLTDRATKEPTAIVSREAAARSGIAEGVKRNAETIVAMGMQKALVRRYQTTNGRFLEANEAASDVVTHYGAISRIFRMFMQSAMLGLGAYLVILGQVSGGVMIAASILMGRALAPIELAVAHWKGFVAARQALARLRKTMAALGDGAEPMALPAPKRMLTVDQVFAAAPGSQEPIIQGISFSLLAGQALGIIGPSASGKSTLARVLAGSWLPLRGRSGSTAPNSRNGAPMRAAASLVISPRISVCSTARSPRISPASSPMPIRRRSSRRPAPPAPTTSSASSPPAMRRALARAALRSLAVSASGWRSPARSTAIPFWWCSTNPMPISMPRARRRSPRRSATSATVAALPSWWRTGRAPSRRSTWSLS
nr:ABC transporter transmembrane domain-containing protein [Phreatobacter stygius]